MQINNLATAKYTADVPKIIIFGDEQHIKNNSSNPAAINKLLSIIKIEEEERKRSICKIIVEENELLGFNSNGLILTTMIIYIAPEEYIDTYINGNLYEKQELLTKEIETISQSYKISIDNHDDEFSVRENSVWGKETTIFRNVEDNKIYIDARILSITFPENTELDDTESYLNYFFKNLEEIEEND